MSEERNSSGQTSSSAAADGSPDGNKAEASTQHNSSQEIRIDEGASKPASADLEDLEQGAGMELAEALRRLEEAEEMVRRHQDDMLRLQAEMQNLRRRTELDVEKAHKYGQERFVTELVNVIDNLERTLDAASTDEAGESGASDVGAAKLQAIREGVDLTLKSFADCFRRFNVESIDPLGEPFDPQRHEAMAAVENGNVEPNTVTAVMQKGYLLHGRVIRPARVLVSK